ncbi:MAG: hypothetical protein ACK5GN_03760 [Pseudomonadota bacterium]
MNSSVSSELETVVAGISEWLAQGGQMPLSDALYAAVASRAPKLFDRLQQLGVLTALPEHSSRQIGVLKLTPLGVLPHALIQATGIEQELSKYLIESLNPFCSRCGCYATPPIRFDRLSVPESGFVSLSVVDDYSRASLQERCEWLAAERALIGAKLVRVEDISSDDGEPVLAVIPTNGPGGGVNLIGSEVSRWFMRGGGELRLMHFVSREALGRELAVVSGSWRCSGCSATIPEPTRALIDSSALCGACQGLGWLEQDVGRLTACRDCDGFGRATEFASYTFHGVPLKHVAALSFAEVLAHSATAPDELRNRLHKIVARGFGQHALGTPVALLSPGERVSLTALCGDISGFERVQYLTDLALGSLKGDELAGALGLASVVTAKPESFRSKVTQDSVRSRDREITLRDIRRGCLDLSEVRFPCGGISFIRGPAGSGKSLLISEVAARFAKRRKLAHLGSFGDIARCTKVHAEPTGQQSVLEALGLADELAFEIARTRKAQELGILKEELVLPRSRYRCEICNGVGVIARVCAGCEGALYDWRIADLPLAGTTVRGLLTTPCIHLGQVVCVSQKIESVLRAWPKEGGDQVALSTPLARLTRPEQRFIALWGGLIKVLGFGEGQLEAKRSNPRAVLSRDMVLVDGPAVMPHSQLSIIEDMLCRINNMGATVIYADTPQGLELGADCVLQLTLLDSKCEQRARQQYLDTRYARRSVA